MKIGTSNENADSNIKGGIKMYKRTCPDKLITYYIDCPKAQSHGESAPIINPTVKSIGVYGILVTFLILDNMMEINKPYMIKIMRLSIPSP